MSESIDRRRFVGRALSGVALTAAALTGCGRTLSPDELAERRREGSKGREAWWLAASKAPGQHELMPLPYGQEQLTLKLPGEPKLKGISAQVVEWHHGKHHAGYVKALNAIEQQISQMTPIEANANYSPFTELKRRETFNASGMYLHNLYWRNMTPGGVPWDPQQDLVRKLIADFGSMERWREEFVATANTPNTGWAVLAMAPYDLKLHNYACSFHDLGGVWGAVPLIACDVWEHAYYFDYGPDRGSYVESFLRLLDWDAIDDTFLRWVEVIPR